MHSDYLAVFTGPSLLSLPAQQQEWGLGVGSDKDNGKGELPGAGMGLFARHRIPAGAIICEYHGLTYRYQTYLNDGTLQASDKLSSLLEVDGEQFISVGEGPCALANDAVWFSDRVYSDEEMHQMFQVSVMLDVIPRVPGFEYNAYRTGQEFSDHKSFLRALKDIPAGAEILYPYGK